MLASGGKRELAVYGRFADLGECAEELRQRNVVAALVDHVERPEAAAALDDNVPRACVQRGREGLERQRRTSETHFCRLAPLAQTEAAAALDDIVPRACVQRRCVAMRRESACREGVWQCAERLRAARVCRAGHRTCGSGAPGTYPLHGWRRERADPLLLTRGEGLRGEGGGRGVVRCENDLGSCGARPLRPWAAVWSGRGSGTGSCRAGRHRTRRLRRRPPSAAAAASLRARAGALSASVECGRRLG